ncbi:MAG: hypothetical protein CM15mP46_6590 [Alphaproteobacteria bacterium]|nr:MAG: hypothetical protein CM15mP46_6590 [Alphaproteobacteria bacterium]
MCREEGFLPGARKRNQGRLRDLDRLRGERAKAGGITQRSMHMETGQLTACGQLVLESH